MDAAARAPFDRSAAGAGASRIGAGEASTAGCPIGAEAPSSTSRTVPSSSAAWNGFCTTAACSGVNAATRELVAAVARHEDRREVAAPRAQLVGELRAAHAGHHDVRDEEVERVPAGELQRLRRIRGGMHPVARILERHLLELPQGGLVLDQEHALRPALRSGRLGDRLGRGH